MSDKPYAGQYEHIGPALFRATNLVVEKGEGPYLYTVSGERYLDFVSGIAVNNIGHCHPRIVQAIKDQAEKCIHSSFNLAYYPSILELSSRLAQVTPGKLDMFVFANSGGEAVEAALKLARFTKRRAGIIAYRGAFHGRTMGALSVTSSTVSYRARYVPFLPEVFRVPYPYCYRCPYHCQPETCELECLKEMDYLFDYVVSPEDVASVIFEPVQGEGGYIVPPIRYVKKLREITAERGILLIFDEVQTGFGRTGKMFAAEHFGVIPDIMTMGKAVAGGLPLSVVASTKEIMSAWAPGSHGTTFGGNPVACAAAVANLDVFAEEKVLEQCNANGDYFRKRLLAIKDKYPIVGDVRGLGIMLAVEIVDQDGAPNTKATKFIQQYSEENHLLFFICGTYKNCVRFIPPLNIPKEAMDEGLDIFEQAVAGASKL